MLDYQAEPLVSRAGDIRVHDYHDVDAGGGEVVMVAVRFVSVLLGKKVPNKSTYRTFASLCRILNWADLL
jgi:hypothetical protein